MKVAGTPPAPFWDLLLGACVPKPASCWAASARNPYEIAQLDPVAQVVVKSIFSDGSIHHSCKRPLCLWFLQIAALRRREFELRVASEWPSLSALGSQQHRCGPRIASLSLLPS